jgi:leucyl aminopeptidase (aminopeptidase T)
MNMQDFRRMSGAAKLLDECLRLKKGERAVIVTDLNTVKVAEVLASAIHERGCEVSLCIMTPRTRHGEEPTAAIAAAMSEADVVLMPVTYSLTHSNARKNANAKGARILTMPGYKEDMLVGGGLDADFQAIRPTVLKLAKLLEEAESVHVTSAAGTDLRLSIKGKKSCAFTGIADQPGTWAAPPAIEAATAPVEDSTTGILVVDGFLMPGGAVTSEVRIEFNKGKAVSITGGAQATEFRQLLAGYNDPNVYYAVELGFGLNTKAKFGRNYLEDETTYGTAHIGLGEGRTFGSTISACAHMDLVLDRPTVEIDGKVVLSDRQVRLD